MTPRKGDKVRVTYEAELASPYMPGEERRVKVGYAYYTVPSDASIEVIEDLRPGDVYRATPDDGARPHIVAYIGTGSKPWYCLTCQQWSRDFLIPRPLTLLVRDGNPVTS